jgi:hypothetical protein
MHNNMHNKTVRPGRWASAGLAAAALATISACGDVKVKAEPKLPVALVSQLPLTVGVFYPSGFRTYVHREDRWGSGYEVNLGPGHVQLADQLFHLEFAHTVPVENLTAAPKSPALAAIVEPRIERFSFLTARDTGGQYFAVTIDYRLNLFNSAGERIDSFTFVGYGSAPSTGIKTETPLFAATQAAMRDAAAKFLVQFPEQATVKRLLKGETITPLAELKAQQDTVPAGTDTIEAVPIEERKTDVAPSNQLRGS